MSLSSTSNTINAVGIFGRLRPDLEERLFQLEEKYSKLSDKDVKGVFNHLSLVINENVPVGELPKYLDLLRELKPFLPLTLQIKDAVINEDRHLALTFSLEQTQTTRDIASHYFAIGIVETWYIKVVWFVPPELQPEAIHELNTIKEIVFSDFVLVANQQNDANTIYSSKRYILDK